jgi:hypothetical protein
MKEELRSLEDWDAEQFAQFWEDYDNNKLDKDEYVKKIRQHSIEYRKRLLQIIDFVKLN